MKIKKEPKTNELFVVKANRLVEATYRITLVEKRIILLAVALARKSGKGLSPMDFVTITVKDYINFYGEALNPYQQLKDAILSLYERGFTLYDKDPLTGKREVIVGRWISTASYIDGAGTIRLQFSPTIIPYITELEREFTKYTLEQIAELSSPYAIRLYELLTQWKSTGTREIEITWLRKIFLLEDKYQAINDFKKWVIDPSVSQINKHTDITVSYTQRKTGRVVSHLNFTIVQKDTPPKRLQAPESHAIATRLVDPAPQPPQPVEAKEGHKIKNTSSPPEITPRDSVLLQCLRNHGIGEKLATTWLNQDEARAKAALEYTEERAQQGHIKGQLAGYLRKLFESGNEINGPSAKQAVAQQKAEEQAQREKARKERERLAEIAHMQWLSEASGTPLEKLLPKHPQSRRLANGLAA